MNIRKISHDADCHAIKLCFLASLNAAESNNSKVKESYRNMRAFIGLTAEERVTAKRG